MGVGRQRRLQRLFFTIVGALVPVAPGNIGPRSSGTSCFVHLVPPCVFVLTSQCPLSMCMSLESLVCFSVVVWLCVCAGCRQSPGLRMMVCCIALPRPPARTPFVTKFEKRVWRHGGCYIFRDGASDKINPGTAGDNCSMNTCAGPTATQYSHTKSKARQTRQGHTEGARGAHGLGGLGKDQWHPTPSGPCTPWRRVHQCPACY